MAAISSSDIYLIFSSLVDWTGSTWTILRSFSVGGVSMLTIFIILLILSIIVGVVNKILGKGFDVAVGTRTGGAFKTVSNSYSTYQSNKQKRAALRFSKYKKLHRK